MLNTVPSTLATKLARYCSSSARFRRQKAERMRNAECGMRNVMGRFVPRSVPPRSTFHGYSALRIPHSALSTSHRAVTSQATDPGQAIGTDPYREPHHLRGEPAHDRVCPVYRAGEEVHWEGEHGAEPQRPRDAGYGRRQQRQRRDPTGEEQGHARMELHDRGGACRPERQQSRGEADEEPHRGGEQHRDGRDRPAAGRERQAHRGPHPGDDEPDHEDDARGARLVGDILRHRLVCGIERPGEPVVEISVADPAVQIPGIPGDRQLVDEHDAEEVAGEVGARVSGDLSRSRDRPPDAQRDGRLGHPPQEPEHDRRPVLEVDEPGVADQRRVPADHSPSSTPRANARRITSSIGGSSIERSATGKPPSSRALVAGASSRRTSSIAFGKRKLFTSPNAARVSAVTRLPSSPPPPSTSSIRLVRAIRVTSASSAPSYSSRPRLIIKTRNTRSVTPCIKCDVSWTYAPGR